MTTIIYVRLLNEGVDVFRPIKAEFINNNMYQIIEKNYEINDKYGEIWEFNQGDVVECDTSKGYLRAIKVVNKN